MEGFKEFNHNTIHCDDSQGTLDNLLSNYNKIYKMWLKVAMLASALEDWITISTIFKTIKYKVKALEAILNK